MRASKRPVTQRGIVNAICSKNEFASAQVRLQQADVWDFFDDAELFTYQKRGNAKMRVVLSESATYSVTPVTPSVGQDADAWLCEQFDAQGLITPERFRENLLWIVERRPPQCRLLLMTLPEFNYFRDALPTFPQYRRQCLRMNRVIRALCLKDACFSLVVMNHHITDRKHFTDAVMHLRPERGFQIACEAPQQMAARPVDTGLAAQLPTQGRHIVLLGKGLEVRPYWLALLAAGVPVSVCASGDCSVDLGRQSGPLSAVAGKTDECFAIVTPQLSADAAALQALGFAGETGCWIVPEQVFNLDWKER